MFTTQWYSTRILSLKTNFKKLLASVNCTHTQKRKKKKKKKKDVDLFRPFLNKLVPTDQMTKTTFSADLRKAPTVPGFCAHCEHKRTDR